MICLCLSWINFKTSLHDITTSGVYLKNVFIIWRRVDITLCQRGKFPATLLLKFFVLYYERNIKLFSVYIYSYINTRENWKNSKFCENTPPCGRRVSTQFLVFPISTRVDITVCQHGKCFIFLK